MKFNKQIQDRPERESWVADGWLDKGTYKYEVVISWSFGNETVVRCRADS